MVIKIYYLQERGYLVDIFRVVYYFGICVEGYIQTLLVYWNHIDEDIQLLRVDRGSHGWLLFEINLLEKTV